MVKIIATALLASSITLGGGYYYLTGMQRQPEPPPDAWKRWMVCSREIFDLARESEKEPDICAQWERIVDMCSGYISDIYLEAKALGWNEDGALNRAGLAKGVDRRGIAIALKAPHCLSE